MLSTQSVYFDGVLRSVFFTVSVPLVLVVSYLEGGRKGLWCCGFALFLVRFCGNFYFNSRYCGFKTP